jgi:acetyltransferase-like isoleucine patch superfamily enzyme
LIPVLKKAALILAAIMPFNSLRISLYRLLAGYHISYDSRIGWLNYLDIEECEIDGAHIGRFNAISCHTLTMAPGSCIDRFNRIKNTYRVALREGASVGTRNHFVGTRPGLTPFKKHEIITIGKNSIITVGHMFDLSDTITIGDDVTFGGRGTEVWTHGFDLNHVKVQAAVEIGSSVYLGSRCIIVQGVRIADGISIGAGTIVPRSISEPGFYISSQLIQKGAVADYSQSGDNVIVHNKARFVRKESDGIAE